MLTEKGALTDIGSWYLNGSDTGNIPHARDASDASSLALASQTVMGMTIATMALISYL